MFYDCTLAVVLVLSMFLVVFIKKLVFYFYVGTKVLSKHHFINVSEIKKLISKIMTPYSNTYIAIEDLANSLIFLCLRFPVF